MLKLVYGFLAIVVCVWIYGVIMLYVNPDMTPVESKEEWCEVGTVNSDGSISYTGSAGTTELIVLATSQGPKLMAQCK